MGRFFYACKIGVLPISEIWDEVEVVCEAPAIGELKTGDLSGFRVHKFKFHGQEYLLAYLPSVSDPEPGDGDRPTPVISVYQLGPHENFYLSGVTCKRVKSHRARRSAEACCSPRPN
jgi:hypothetical protein